MTDRVILLASSKGGVGKSTLALGIARALATRKKTVLLADFDFANPCLDLLSGTESQIVFTLADAADGLCQPQQALLPIDREHRLLLLPAPAAETDLQVAAKQAAEVLRKAAEQSGADFVLLDTGAGFSAGLEAAVSVATGALVAAGHNPVSIRAAERTGQRLHQLGIQDVRLAVNAFDCAKNGRMSLLEIIDGTGIPLAGAVPYDAGLLLSQEGIGKIDRGPAAQAFENIAARLDGETVPLFDRIPKIRKHRRRLFR